MTFSSDDFPYLAQVASRVDADRLYQYDFAPAHLVPLGSMQGMQAKVQNIFSEPEPEPEPQRPEQQLPAQVTRCAALGAEQAPTAKVRLDVAQGGHGIRARAVASSDSLAAP